jgi:putative endonuclease
MYYTYILKCIDNSYYVGSTGNINERIKMHNSGKGAGFTAKRNPVVLVWLHSFTEKKQALLKELEIKKFSRLKKEKLIFIKGSTWKHYKGGKYIILGVLDDLIVYSELNGWKNYSIKNKQVGQQCQVWLRDKDQWLDWIDKNKKLLRFNLAE